MSTVLLYMSMSLDGYVAGPDVSADEPMGVGGERLHDWMFADPVSEVDRAMDARVRGEVGAVVVGRRTFDLGLRYWQDVPFPAPSFVVTHESRGPLEQRSGTFTFVGDVAKAVEEAAEQAGEKKVVLMGADLDRQALRAGLVDEVLINHVPVLLGGGTRLFEGLPHTELVPFEVVASPVVTHVRYRVLR
ncbi:dihydrofolate reductase family protein [Actinophytocola sp.]|uniref:dihydrofolate reductase family protein n=1 Tax=Actinophytocola sp. TaxID=1872138 RepID=UPI003D6B2605